VGAMLSALGIKDIVYGVLIAAALAYGGWTYHKYESAVAYAATAKAETAQVQKAAALAIQNSQNDYAAKLAATQETQNAQLKAAAASSATLAARLRQYQANRCPNPVLGSAAAAASGGVADTGSVESALEQLAAAAAHDNAVIVAERAERDSLTGK
jgi:hypothetical protein